MIVKGEKRKAVSQKMKRNPSKVFNERGFNGD